MQLNTYLFFNGNCEAAFKYYEKCLGGKIDILMSHAGSPAEQQVPSEWRDKVLHARLVVNNQVLMASDCPPDRAQKPDGFYVSLQVDSEKEAERIFNALAKNGQVRMPLQKTFFATAFAMLVDQFGTPWMINCE